MRRMISVISRLCCKPTFSHVMFWHSLEVHFLNLDRGKPSQRQSGMRRWNPAIGKWRN